MSDENAPQMVPLERLNKAIEARREAEARAKTAELRVAELEPQIAGLESLSEQLAAEKAGRTEDAARFAARESFLGAGIKDSDEMEIIRSRWDALPKKDRPTLSDWLADGAANDKIASRFLQAAETPAEAPQAPTEAAAPPTPNTNRGAAPTPPAAREMTREVYYERLAGAKNGDERRAIMSEYARGN